MKLTKNIITRAEALALCPDYVAFVEGDHDKWEAIGAPFMWDYDSTDRHAAAGVKVGQSAITFFDGHYVRVKISSIREPHHGADGPVVRVSNGEASWRVDGDKYAYILHPTEALRKATKSVPSAHRI